MSRRILLSVLFGISVFLVNMVVLSSRSFSIIEGGDFDDPSLWFTHVYFGQGANGSLSIIEDGKLYMVINDTSSMNSYSRVQQGSLPHNWIPFEPPQLNQEITVRRFLEANDGCLWLQCRMQRSDFQYYGSNSWVNTGFIFWFDVGQGYNEDINHSKALGLDIQVYSTAYDNGKLQVRSEVNNTGVRGHKIWQYNESKGGYELVPCDYDYHYYSFERIHNTTQTYEFTVDVGSHIKKAFEEFGIIEAKLKDFDIFVEANNGYGSVTVYDVDLLFSPDISSSYVLIHSGIYGSTTFIAVFILTSILGKRSLSKSDEGQGLEIRG